MTTNTASRRAVPVVRAYPLTDDAVPEVTGRTVVGLCVPYGQAVLVRDNADSEPYRERFVPGAFADFLRRRGKRRVAFNYTHSGDIYADVGYAARLWEEPAGLHAEFAVDRSAFGDAALEKARTGQLCGLSVSALVHETRRATDGVVERVRASLRHVALCEVPQYTTAGVLAVRSGYPAPRLMLLLERGYGSTETRRRMLGEEP
jgi:HK97 family phage prohead protease